MVLLLDLVRLFAGASLLSFATYTDWKWRRAPNVLWGVLALVGLVVLAGEIALDPALVREAWRNLAFIPLFALIVYALWYVGLIAGGADAKALMALGVLLPFPVLLGAPFPLLENPVPGWPLAASVLGNALLLFMVVPLAFLVWNVLHGHVRLPHAFLGVKRPAREVGRAHEWPMESVDEAGARRTRLFPSRMEPGELDALVARLRELGDEKVWVTPKIPFMLPLLLGFVSAFFVGDLMLGLIFRLMS